MTQILWLRFVSDVKSHAAFSANEKTTQTNCTLNARIFARFDKVPVAGISDWIMALFAPFVINQSNSFGFWIENHYTWRMPGATVV